MRKSPLEGKARDHGGQCTSVPPRQQLPEGPVQEGTALPGQGVCATPIPQDLIIAIDPHLWYFLVLPFLMVVFIVVVLLLSQQFHYK